MFCDAPWQMKSDEAPKTLEEVGSPKHKPAIVEKYEVEVSCPRRSDLTGAPCTHGHSIQTAPWCPLPMPLLCVTMSQCGRGLLRASCAPDGQLIPRLPHSLWEVDQVEVAPDVTVRRALCELSAEKKADFLVAGAFVHAIPAFGTARPTIQYGCTVHSPQLDVVN